MKTILRLTAIICILVITIAGSCKDNNANSDTNTETDSTKVSPYSSGEGSAGATPTDTTKIDSTKTDSIKKGK